VLEVPLGGGTSHAPEPSGITIKFALAVEARGDVNANELQATDAVNRGTDAISALRPAPQIVNQMDSAIGIGTKGTTELQTCKNTWNVLLKRMILFNKIVAVVAEMLVNQQNRDDRVIRLAGTMSDVFSFVEDAEPLKAVEAHKEPTKLLIQQVMECGYVTGEYAKQNNFWMTFSSIPLRMRLGCTSLPPLQARASPPSRTRSLDCSTGNKDWARRIASLAVTPRSTIHKIYSALSRATSPVTQLQSALLPIHLMEVILSLALGTTPFEFGI